MNINNSKFKLLGILPFLLMISIGLFSSNTLTMHQKVFKTLLLILFTGIMIAIAIYWFYTEKERHFKIPGFVVFYFTTFFIYILIQYTTGFFTKAVIYDSNYYLSNYIVLLLFGFLFYYKVQSFTNFKSGLLVISFFILIALVWSSNDFYKEYTFPSKLSSNQYNKILKSNTEKTHLNALRSGYQKTNDGSYTLSKTNNQNFSSLKKALKNGGIHKSHTFTKVLASLRPKLSFGNTNYFAAFFIGIYPLALISCFIFFIDRKEKRYNLYYAIATGLIAVIGIIPLLLTQTTAAFFGLYMSFIIFAIPALIFLIPGVNKMMKSIMLLAFLIIFFAVPLYIAIFNPHALDFVSPRLTEKLADPVFEIKDRMNGWTPAIKLFQEYPVTGAGLGSFYAASFKYASKYFYIYSSSNSFKHAHNEYLEILSEGGIIGITFFLFLMLSLLTVLALISFSSRYKTTFRLAVIGTATGIIAILLQQIFSLTLRMSVTMTAFFSLIGMALFLITIRNHHLSKIVQSYPRDFLSFLDGGFFDKLSISKDKFIYVIYGFVGMLVISIFLFRPLFVAENAIMKANFEKNPKMKEAYYKIGEKAMPDNPYLLTKRYEYAISALNYYNSLIKSDKYNHEQFEKEFVRYFKMALEDLDKINNIIYGYQIVWSKYLNLWSILFDFSSPFSSQRNTYLEKIYFYLNKTLNDNYLLIRGHKAKIYYGYILELENEYERNLKEYCEGWIYLNYGRNKKILKENISIIFSDETSTQLNQDNNNYKFIINNEDISIINKELQKDVQRSQLIIDKIFTVFIFSKF